MNQCSNYIAAHLEAELARARTTPADTEGISKDTEKSPGPGQAVVWRAALPLPAEGRGTEGDQLLQHLLVAVHSTRYGSGSQLIRNRLEHSRAPAVRLLATLQTVEGDCTARVQRGAQGLLISLVVLDPMKLLAAELNTTNRSTTAD